MRPGNVAAPELEELDTVQALGSQAPLSQDLAQQIPHWSESAPVAQDALETAFGESAAALDAVAATVAPVADALDAAAAPAFDQEKVVSVDTLAAPVA